MQAAIKIDDSSVLHCTYGKERVLLLVAAVAGSSVAGSCKLSDEMCIKYPYELMVLVFSKPFPMTDGLLATLSVDAMLSTLLGSQLVSCPLNQDRTFLSLNRRGEESATEGQTEC